MTPRAAFAVLLTLPLLGCGTSHRPSTDLTLVALNTNVGRAEFHLTCDPTGGDVPAADRTCAALTAHPTSITAAKPFTCAGGPSSWWEVRIRGRLGGRAVDRTLSTCWTSQMATIGKLGIGEWDVLRKHLVPRRHEAVPRGATETFAAGLVRPTDLVTCRILGHRLEAGVPIASGQPSGVGFGGDDVVSVTLRVVRHSDGSVTASCSRGARGATSRISHHA